MLAAALRHSLSTQELLGDIEPLGMKVLLHDRDPAGREFEQRLISSVELGPERPAGTAGVAGLGEFGPVLVGGLRNLLAFLIEGAATAWIVEHVLQLTAVRQPECSVANRNGC